MTILKEFTVIGAIVLVVVAGVGVANTNFSATNDTEDRIAQLEEQVRILSEEATVHEEHILALEWTDEAKVIDVVQNAFGNTPLAVTG